MSGKSAAMRITSIALAACCIFTFTATAAEARSTFETPDTTGGAGNVSGALQCVPYARRVSGIQIYGDAWTWWNQAEGHYARGKVPRIGAVMAVQPHGNSRLGHVAAVSGIVDSRTILLRHANWSQPGLIEDNVKAVDVSPQNDWSEVRIWYAPTQSLGTGHWPLYGFIYSDKPRKRESASRIGRRDTIADIIAGRYR